MKFLKTTFIGGVLVLLPLVACLYLLGITGKAVFDAIKPLAKLLPFKETETIVAVYGAAAGVILLACFFFGLIVKTAWGAALGRWVEDKIFCVLPGYSMIRRLARQIGGEAGETLGKPVLVRNGEVKTFAFLVDELPDGRAAVYVPTAPVLTIGTLQIAPMTHIEALNVPLTDYVKCIGEFGVGTAALLASKLK